MALNGSAFLEASVGAVLRRICTEKVAVDTDALRGGKTKTTDKNVELLVHWCQELWKSIYHARDYCPRHVFHRFGTIFLLTARTAKCGRCLLIYGLWSSQDTKYRKIITPSCPCKVFPRFYSCDSSCLRSFIHTCLAFGPVRSPSKHTRLVY